MALPDYVVRSYAGGAQAAQLVENMGVTDTSFAITTTVGWTESAGPNIGSPLGTSGPFTVVIDRFTDTVEKIDCSAVNLATGIVTVNLEDGSGRGYDGSTAQAHVPSGSASGVQTTWPAQEAFEANQAVAYLLGTAGGARTPGNGLVLDGSGNPSFAPIAGIQSVSLWGVGAAAYGSPPARLTGTFLIQGGNIGPTFASGFYSFIFPESFPNGTLGFFPSVQNATPAAPVIVTHYSTSPASVELTANVNGTAYSGGLTIDWFAIGF